MEQEKKQWGGKRPGAGAKVTKNRPHRLTINISDKVRYILNTKGNKSDYLEKLILNDSK